MKTSAETNEINAALSKAQGELKIAGKDATNPFFKSRYSDFQSIIEAARPALVKNGLSVIQGGYWTDGAGGWLLITRISHSSGQWYESEFPIQSKDQTAQAFGSAVTYAKRYAFAAMVGVVSGDEDDDGESAMGRSSKAVPKELPKHNQLDPPKVIAPSLMLATPEQIAVIWSEIKTRLNMNEGQAKDFIIRISKKQTSKDLTVADIGILRNEIDAVLNIIK